MSPRDASSSKRRWPSTGPPASAARATALDGAGVLAETQGDYDRAEALHREALALSRERGDTTGIARALGNLGVVAFDRGDDDQATTFLEESLALAREIGDQLLVATALNDLGSVAYKRGDLDRAELLYQESLSLRRQAGSGSEIARSLNNLGAVAFDRGDFDRRLSTLRGERQPLSRCRRPLGRRRRTDRSGDVQIISRVTRRVPPRCSQRACRYFATSATAERGAGGPLSRRRAAG